MKRQDFVIRLKSHKPRWKVYLKGNEDNHAHFNTKRGCETLIRLLVSGVLPDEPYYQEAARRVVPDIYDSLRPKRRKDDYLNCRRFRR